MKQLESVKRCPYPYKLLLQVSSRYEYLFGSMRIFEGIEYFVLIETHQILQAIIRHPPCQLINLGVTNNNTERTRTMGEFELFKCTIK